MEPASTNGTAERSQNGLGLPVIALGTARLPAGALGDKPSPLIIELALDDTGTRVLEVATNIPLPGYNRMLRRLLVEKCLKDADAIAEQIESLCKGPLMKPTVAALKNAVAQTHREPTAAS